MSRTVTSARCDSVKNPTVSTRPSPRETGKVLLETSASIRIGSLVATSSAVPGFLLVFPRRINIPETGRRRFATLEKSPENSKIPAVRAVLQVARKTFNPLTGTPLAGLHHQDRWPDQAQALIAGETIAKAAERCKVAYTTAFRWRHRFLSALNLDKPRRLSGIVEADETFILESFKGKRRDLPRASRKRGGKAAKRVCRRSRSQSSSPATAPARPSMPSCRGSTPPASRPRSGRSSIGQRNCAAMEVGRSPHSLGAPGSVPCLARTRHAKAGGARSPHQQRERLPRPAEGVDAALPWRRHQEPSELSELAANDRGPLNRLGPGRLDHGRPGLGPYQQSSI